MTDKPKLLYINNLRILLTILIVLLHIAITYGATGFWYYHENTNDILTKVILTLFVATAQSFVLGFFFLVAGYFTENSYRHKGVKQFIADRFIKLGIPLLIFYFIINPVIIYFLYVKLKGETIPISELFGAGPLWFVEVLLIFSITYCFIYKSNFLNKFYKLPAHKEIFIYAIILSLLNFAVRILSPIGKFIFDCQFAHFPGYISLYIIGIMSFKNKWFDKFPYSIGLQWFKIAILLIIPFPAIMILGGGLENAAPFLGGLHWQSFILSTWEAFVGIGMILGLHVIFHKKFDYQKKLLKLMTDNSYSVYIIHSPVIVAFSYLVRNILLNPLLKFICVSFITVPLCFIISLFINYISNFYHH